MLAACGDDDDRGPASVGVIVTGLENDATPRKAKTWNWDCEENGEEVDCVYRHAITTAASHDFKDDEYDEYKSATTPDELDGKHYIHVQAESKETDNKSEVETVSVTLDNTLPNDPEPNNFDVPSSSNDSPIQITVKNLKAGDIVRIYVDDPEEKDTENSNFLSNVWSFVAPALNLSSTTSPDTICTNDNKVGEKTVSSGQTEVTVDVDANVSEHEYYATIEDAAGNESACIKVFTYENIFVPEPPAPTACPSIKRSPHWKFVDGLCRPSCGAIASRAGYGSGTHIRGGSDTCNSLTANGYSDWTEFYIEEGGQTISSNDAWEIAERGGVCCKRGTANNPRSAPVVTGLDHDLTPGLEKTFTWGCDQSNCRYRYAINKYSSHTFPESTVYTNTTTVTKTHLDRRTKYYLHVQAASSSRESAVKSVSFILVPPTPPKVIGLDDDPTPKAVKVWRWNCDKGSCTYRYAINQNQNHTFTNESYGQDRIATKQITNSNENGTYYLHVQAQDVDGNESEVTTVLAILEISISEDIRVTGLSHDTNAGDSKTWNWGCDSSSCTYRYAINQSQGHIFTNEDLYNSTQTTTKTITSASDNGAYFLHVQAKDANNDESEVETVLAVLEVPNTTNDVQVTGLNHDTSAGASKTWNWGCNKSSCTYRYAINQTQTHTFSGSGGYGSTQRAVKTISSASDNGTYYLHVQAKDANNNESEVETVLAVLEIPTTVSDVRVTGLLHDTSTGTSKIWNWGCNQSSCTYRYAINQAQAHHFGNASYGSTQTATKSISSASDNGTYYLHVQARDANNDESEVETVLAVLEVPDTTSDVQVTGLAHDTVEGSSKTWNWGCNKGSCTYRAVINQSPNHTFSSRYGSTQTTTKTITSASDNGTYYLHVQAKDSNNNESEVKTVLAILKIPTTTTSNVQVTGLLHDDVPKTSKTWNWTCNKGSCTYRYVVNQAQTHNFGSASYDSTQTTTKAITSASDNGTYYLHVQAKNSNNDESEVETVLAVLEVPDTTSDVQVTGLAHDTVEGSSKTWNWGCNKGSCTYRAVINQSQTHTFSSSYGSTQTTTKTITSASENGTYYLHVQAKDSNNNESEVKTVLAILKISTTTTSNVQVTGLLHDDVPKTSKTWNWGCNQGSCTYRYAVNQTQTHNFGRTGYGSTQRAVKTISSASENGTYYLHVQAKDSNNNESEVKTVLAILKISTTTTSDVQVTGLLHDDVPKTSKTWTWSCNKGSCTYRYAVNQAQSHTFSSGGYTSTQSAVKAISSANENGVYYLHVQARDSNNNESEVKTVIAIFEISSVVGTVQVTGLSHDTDPKRSKAWNWGCDKSSCTYRYTINQSQTHTFSNSDRYRSTQTATKRITSSSQNGTYYLHVQAKDGGNNESQIRTILVILRYSGGVVGDLAVIGVEDDIIAKDRKIWRWYCTNNSGACSYRYVVNQTDTHTFPDSHSFDSSQMAEQTAGTDDNGTYYLHVQAKDGANNLSAVRSVVAYLTETLFPSSLLNFICNPSESVGKSTLCSWGVSGGEYRHIISESATHIFGVDDLYSMTTTSAIIDVANGNRHAGTTYYLHVQGKDANGNLSDIETNFITLTAKEIVVKIDEEESKKLNKMSQKWKWECDETPDAPAEAATPDCVYRYAVTKDESHTFDNNDGYGSNEEITKTLTHKDENGTYYLHVQTKDADNNVSAVKSSDPGVELAFELDLALKDPEPHTAPTSDGGEEEPTSLQLHLNKTPTFTLRGVLDNHKVTLYSSSECTDGSNDDNGDPTKDTRISSEITMSSGQVDITIPNNKFSDLTTYPIYVGVKDSNNDIDCYAATSTSSATPVIADDTNKDTIAPLFEYTLYNPIAGGVEKTCYLSTTGDVKCWGDGTETPDSLDSSKAKAVVVGGENNECRILSDDTATCTGNFVPTENNDEVNAIALGADHACSILKEDNSVYCSGDDNDKGQLGTGTASSGAVNLGCDGPSNSCDQLKAKDIVAGDNHTCVILLDENENNPGQNYNGRVLCWGHNAKGQLGQNDILNHGAEPDLSSQDTQPSLVSQLDYVNLGSGRTAKSITAGQNHTCALLDNNTVKCWGHNILGQLGRNNVIDYGTDNNQMSSLGTISLGRSAASIFTGVGSNHTCAVLDNNTVKCWGNNWKGQLGQNDKTNVDEDGEIGSDDDPDDPFLDGSKIVINRNHGSGRGNDVPLKTGESRSNILTKTVSSLSTLQFGCNSGTDRNGEPLPCSSSNNFKLKVPYGIAVGKDHACAVLVTDQESDKGKDFVKCWGSNDKKQLGHDEDKSYGSSTTDSVEKAPFLEFAEPEPEVVN